ncbi:hypothetical protein [Bradyrhizobium sp.]|uniref:hypothetical protein n=1 Tax=Bradyrhizobium sp. TaxID=376 RepID=UPI003C4AFF75
MREIGAFEATNKFGQLLDWVEQGKRSLSPMAKRLRGSKAGFNRAEARAALHRIRERAEQLKLGTFDWSEWKALCDKGRP